VAYDDEEQLEAIRDWWHRYGRLVIIAAIAVLAAVLGWQQWTAWQERQAANASADYAAILQALNSDDREAAGNRLRTLREAHADSPYVAMATFAVATAAMDAGNPGRAADALGWVTDQQADSPLAVVARLRQAEALRVEGDRSAALAVLEPLPDGPLRGRFLELQGDLEVAQGNTDAAIEAYQQALQAISGQRRSLVEIKLFDLGGAPAS
jgi:predicted negative regulator of RcsB-dependent stress response